MVPNIRPWNSGIWLACWNSGIWFASCWEKRAKKKNNEDEQDEVRKCSYEGCAVGKEEEGKILFYFLFF